MSPTNSDSRCQFRNAEGKRCRMLCALDHDSLCSYHAGWLAEKPPSNLQPQEDLTPELLGPFGDFRSEAAINYTLGKLVTLFGSRRISAREAGTFGYLCQLLLQSVQGANHEVPNTTANGTEDEQLLLAIRQNVPLMNQAGQVSAESHYAGGNGNAR
jgi:hypothetical protein